ncbi:MAG: hypothetical protein KJ955_05725 [Nanoarchaeota archaeon]|nr:hypothetical protein [Nanoarchaeota archaeon]
MKPITIAAVAVAGLAALTLGCKDTPEKNEKEFRGILQANAPACENSPYVGMNEQNLQIQCGGYSSACYMMPEDKKTTCYSFWMIRMPDGAGNTFLQCHLVEEVGVWQETYDSYHFQDMHCDGNLEEYFHARLRNVSGTEEEIGSVVSSFELPPIDAAVIERYNRDLEAIGENQIKAMWQERFGQQ